MKRNLIFVLVSTVVLLAPGPHLASAQYAYQQEILPVAEEYGVGFVEHRRAHGESFGKYDGSASATYGNYRLEFFGEDDYAWAIYDVSHFRTFVQVNQISLNNHMNSLWLSSPYYMHETQYRRVTQDLRTLDAEPCMNALNDSVYTWFYTPHVDDEVITVLGDMATRDFEAAVNGSGFFIVGITGYGDWWDPGCAGCADDEMVEIRGWAQQYPRLIVEYEYPVPVGPMTWGRIKALYR